MTRRASVIGLVFAAAVTLMGAKGCENPNPQGVTDFGSVVGLVVDAKTQQPIQQFTISIGGQSRNVSPAAKGAYNIDRIPAGTQTLTIYAIGYQTYSQAGVVVQKDQTTEVPPIGIVSTAPQ